VSLEENKKPILLEDLGMMYATEKSKQKTRFGLYKCGYCGNEFKSCTYSVKAGLVKGCGCLSYKHTFYHHPLYVTWNNMVQRCYNPKNKRYKDYGERGIVVCKEWLDIKNFIDWADSTYVEGCTVDRIDNDGNYEPSNCRWADATTQSINQRKRNTNTSGFVGITFCKGYWVCRISFNKRRFYIGSFKTIEEAVQARDNYIIDNNLPHKLSKDYKKE